MDTFKNKLVGIGSGVALLLQVPYFLTWIPFLFGIPLGPYNAAKGLFFLVTIALLAFCIWNNVQCIRKGAKIVGITGLIIGIGGIALTIFIGYGLSKVYG